MARKLQSTAFGAWTVNFAEVISIHLSALCMWGQRHQTSKIPSSLTSSEQNAVTDMKRKELLIIQEQQGFPHPCHHTEAPCVPEQSYMLQDSLEHVQLFDLMRRMLEFDPAQRITLAEALLHPFFAGLTPEERSFHTSRNPSR